MVNEPKISIIMPIYNSANHLERTIKSILDQSIEDYEVILVNDGSTDASSIICETVARNDRRFLCVNQQNSGAAVARNNGLAKAKGKYVVFLDSDDTFDKDMLKESYACAEKNKAQVVYWGSNWIVEDENGIKQCKNSLPYHVWNNGIELTLRNLDLIGHVPWNKLIERKWLLDNGIEFQNIPSNNDIFFSFVIMLLAKHVVWIDKILVTYYWKLPGSLTKSRYSSKLWIIDAFHRLIKWIETEEKVSERAELLAWDNFAVCTMSYIWSEDCDRFVKERLIKDLEDNIEFKNMIINALLYKSLNKRSKFILEWMISDKKIYIPEYNIYKCLVEDIIGKAHMKKKKIALWGTGYIGSLVAQAVYENEEYFDYAIDSDVSKNGNDFWGNNIVTYEQLEIEPDIIIIAGIGIMKSIEYKLNCNIDVFDAIEYVCKWSC